MTTPRDAAFIILEHIERQPALRVPLDDAFGAVLAESIVSPINLPAWANSAMDGYAVRGEDVRGATAAAPRELRVLDYIPAGGTPSRALTPGTCARIFTGAPIPDGCDTVIRQEDTEAGDGTVRILGDRDLGVNIRQPGEDIAAGTTVMTEGQELGAAALGVLASLAVANPLIYRRPRVAILASGDEIVDIDQPDQILAGKKIGSSNSHTLMALVREAGGVPVMLGIAQDTPESVRAHLQPALECDLLLTSAGVSVGEHDHLRAVLGTMGVDLKFWRIRMRPGAPVAFGLLGKLPWIGLPGNPVSTMVTFELFVRPAIRTLCGQRLPFRQTTSIELTEPVRVVPSLRHFLRVRLEPGTDRARLTGAQGSGILSSMLRADGLMVIPEGHADIVAGQRFETILLNTPACQETPPW
ncbi:MAG TPA: gephyrin-like molybdotransferase Glp [Gemmatimonadales bacterium]|nr:gephyrin-like molybdotransferase Glp [Gemmatimonadales bacterium]